MLYYDLVDSGCNIDPKMQFNLGFKKIFKNKNDIQIADVDSLKSDFNQYFIYGSNTSRLISGLRNGSAGLMINDYNLDKKLIQFTLGNKSPIIISINKLMHDTGFSRQRDLLFIRRLIKYIKARKIEFSIVTFADTDQYMCSYIQLLEISKLFFDNPNEAIKHITNLKKLIENER